MGDLAIVPVFFTFFGRLFNQAFERTLRMFIDSADRSFDCFQERLKVRVTSFICAL